MLDTSDLCRWLNNSNTQNLKATLSLELFGLRSTTTALILSWQVRKAKMFSKFSLSCSMPRQSPIPGVSIRWNLVVFVSIICSCGNWVADWPLEKTSFASDPNAMSFPSPSSFVKINLKKTICRFNYFVRVINGLFARIIYLSKLY